MHRDKEIIRLTAEQIMDDLFADLEECDHEWHTAFPVDTDNLPEIQAGWYVSCVHCGTWARQNARWVDDYEEPIGNPVLVEQK